LFAYTGSFTVYAAAGGATQSVTVDLSNTYQHWARRNFELNGMDADKHTLVRDDVFHYLTEAASRGEKFDVIVLDPPSFSNSKKMQGVLDVQRDHPQLIQQALNLLKQDGALFFSTNLRGFAMNESLQNNIRAVDITSRTVPDDFRNKKIHRCFLISRPQSPGV